MNSIKIAFGLCHNIPKLLYNCPFGYSAFGNFYFSHFNILGFSRDEDYYSFCIMADGRIMNQRHPTTEKGESWKPQDRVGVFFDFFTGDAQFFLNGKPQGRVLQFVPERSMHIVVSLINYNQVSLVKPKYNIRSLRKIDEIGDIHCST
jgi:hypothetical protein